MEKMLNEFKEEYICQYSLYLEVSDKLDSLLEQGDYDEQEMADVRARWLRKYSAVRELRRVAKIFGYDQEDIERWEDVEHKEHYDDCWGVIRMFNIGDTLQSKVCPTMAGTIIKLDKNRAVIKITRTRYSKDIGRELVIDTSFWKRI